jgi:hypothetical protein
MKNIQLLVRQAISAGAMLLLAANAQAAPHRSSLHKVPGRTEREQTRLLNEQQLNQARQQNAGLSINADSTASDAAARLADSAPPAAAPTMRVQQADAPAAASPAEPVEAAPPR